MAEDNTTSSFNHALTELGLDASFWAEQFQEVLHVKTTAELKLITKKDIEILRPHARNKLELNTLLQIITKNSAQQKEEQTETNKELFKDALSNVYSGDNNMKPPKMTAKLEVVLTPGFQKGDESKNIPKPDSASSGTHPKQSNKGDGELVAFASDRLELKVISRTQSIDDPLNNLTTCCEQLESQQTVPDAGNSDNLTNDSIQTSSPVKGLLEKFGLEKYYPNKIGLADVIVVHETMINPKKPDCENQLPWYFLHKLKMLDYQARYVHLENNANCASKAGPPETLGENDVFDVPTDDLSTEDSSSLEEDFTINDRVNPMDLQMIVFHCADMFLRQYLFSKLAICQFAVPLIVPHYYNDNSAYNIWACKDIKIQILKGRDIGKVMHCVTAVEKAKVPTVVFMRLGRSPISKSQWMNILLNGQKHHTFFTRHSPGGSEKALLMEGVVEFAWYCPSGNSDDKFENCVAFANLHGNALEQEQSLRDLVNAMSSIAVILATKRELKDKKVAAFIQSYISSNKPVLCLLTDTARESGSKNSNRIAMKNKNETELAMQISNRIKQLMPPLESVESLDFFVDKARDLGFQVDEDQNNCKAAKVQANSIRDLLSKVALSEVKEKCTPSQGLLWHEWCELDKKRSNVTQKGDKGLEQHYAEIDGLKMTLREKQYKNVTDVNEVVKEFIKNLDTDDTNKKAFYLKYIKQYIDELFVDELSKLRNEYNEFWTQSQYTCNASKSDTRHKLEDISQQVETKTFGIEHLFRELGQMYEACKAKNKYPPPVGRLPLLAAWLLRDGQPLELMDGDAAYVPTDWINAILENLIELLGDAKVFVLSVLGLQSSGKSTLLNALFGLQFLVSAGRCTKGAYMQMLKVNETAKANAQVPLSFDYLIVIDTEGLGCVDANVKMAMNHDNELATFVFGMANMTIVNMFGETPSDIQDILQIVVQALLRMKKVDLHPSCVFVHQNVGDLTAGDKNVESRMGLQSKLDEMTRLAAEQENSTVQCFSDVIRFEINKQTFYFSHLWDGNPPMAPPNPKYSRNVQELNRLVFSTSTEAGLSKLSEFKARIIDLWSALRSEQFVFNFRNSLEISEYHKLEAEYAMLTWTLRDAAIHAEITVTNRIKTSPSSMTEDSVTLEITNIITATSSDLKLKLAKLFGHGGNKKAESIRVKWKALFELNFSALCNKMIMEITKRCNALLTMRKSRLEFDVKKDKYEQKLFKKSKELASKLKEKAKEEKLLKQEFCKLWDEIVEEVTKNVEKHEEQDIELLVEVELLGIFQSHPNIHDVVQKYKNVKDFTFEPKRHVEAMSFKSKVKDLAKRKFFNKQQFSCNWTNFHQKDIFGELIQYLNDQQNAGVDFSRLMVSQMTTLVSNYIKNFNEKQADLGQPKVSSAFTIELSCFLCWKCIEKCKDVCESYKNANDLVKFLSYKRGLYYEIFKMYCEGASDVAVIATKLTDSLKDAMRESVYKKTCIDITNNLRSNNPAFNQSRHKLEFYILDNLVKEKDISQYMDYLISPHKYIDQYIHAEFAQACNDKANLESIVSTKLDDVVLNIQDAIHKAKDNAGAVSGSAAKWFDQFKLQLQKKIAFEASLPETATAQGSFNTFDLADTLETCVKETSDLLKLEFAKLSINDLQTVVKQPHSALTEHLKGCSSKCPGCGAMCTLTDDGHAGDHSAEYHRPRAVIGAKWYETDHFVIENCNTCVADETSYLVVIDDKGERRDVPWMSYRNVGPDWKSWSITSKGRELKYWKWFIVQFQEQLKQNFKLNFEGLGKIPEEWNKIKQTDVLDEIKPNLL